MSIYIYMYLYVSGVTIYIVASERFLRISCEAGEERVQVPKDVGQEKCRASNLSSHQTLNESGDGSADTARWDVERCGGNISQRSQTPCGFGMSAQSSEWLPHSRLWASALGDKCWLRSWKYLK